MTVRYSVTLTRKTDTSCTNLLMLADYKGVDVWVLSDNIQMLTICLDAICVYLKMFGKAA